MIIDYIFLFLLNMFNDLSELFLNRCLLKVKDKYFRFVEIEFYLYDSEHKDEYVHRSPNQKLWNKWYFHKKGESYKEGTFKGLDMTFGDDSRYFGILIRSIYDIENNVVIEGSCNIVKRIFKEYNCENVKDFIKQNEVLDMNNNRKDLTVKRLFKSFEDTIYTGSRIGLSDKYPEFKDKKYRFLIFKDKIKKGKKGLLIL